MNDDGKLLPPSSRREMADLMARVAELERTPAVRDMSSAPFEPVGTVLWGVWVNAPPGYLLCDGSSTEGYPALIAVLAAAGLTSTVTPDLRGRVLLGVNPGTYNLGSTGGAATKSLSVAEMPVHNHGGRDGQNFITDGGTNADVARPGGNFQTKAATADAGSGNAFSILPPYRALTPIIRAV